MQSYGNCISARCILIALIIVSPLIGLGGCTRYVWYHHDQKAPLNFQNDKFKCEEDLDKFRADAGKTVEESAIKNRMNDCMKGLGYGWGPAGDAPENSFVYEDNR